MAVAAVNADPNGGTVQFVQWNEQLLRPEINGAYVKSPDNPSRIADMSLHVSIGGHGQPTRDGPCGKIVTNPEGTQVDKKDKKPFYPDGYQMYGISTVHIGAMQVALEHVKRIAHSGKWKSVDISVRSCYSGNTIGMPSKARRDNMATAFADGLGTSVQAGSGVHRVYTLFGTTLFETYEGGWVTIEPSGSVHGGR